MPHFLAGRATDAMSLQAFVSRRVVTAEGIRPAAILVEGEQIQAVVPPAQIPSGTDTHDFGDAAILPGLVDSHVHINDPGRTDWEGFDTATRAAAAGGYTMLVDMPLNCLPATTTVAALASEARSRAEQLLDRLGGVGRRSQRQSGRHRTPRRRGCAGVQVFSDSSRNRRLHHGRRG